MRSELTPGQELHGFRVDRVTELDELASIGITLTHKATGCELFHLYNEDKENVFSFNFRTPPFNSSGVAHILEHSVLCGSKRFPLKDPFVALLKGSMKTFLNAITFPDKTMYPASSIHEKDFYNILTVYGDAVFFPLLKKEVFAQEGHHLEFSTFNDAKSELKVVGVVYNEMKGNYSSQESIAAEWSLRSLFPDTPYGFDSGGEPFSILKLDYNDFLDFHRFYYHPSNCKIYFYGNLPTEKHLEFVESKFLKHFKKIAVDSAIPLQKPFTAPIRIQQSYPCKKGQKLDALTTITVNWTLSQATEGFNILLWDLISEILVGNAGSPLHKALVESGLGQDVYPYSGLETELRQMVFTVGLRGTNRNRCQALENLIVETLHELYTKKIDSELIQAALNRVTFQIREIRGGSVPYGLRLLRRILRGWLHGIPPEETLAFKTHLKRIEKSLDNNQGFLERFVHRYLLTNPHRSTVLVVPDPELTDRDKLRLKEYIKSVERTLTEEKKQELISFVAALKSFQEKKEPQEEIKKIPYLHLQDLPAQVEHIEGTEAELGQGIKLYLHPMATNDITYLDFAFCTEGIDNGLSLFLPLFGKMLTKAGLPDVKYYDVQRKLARLTGGFHGELLAHNVSAEKQKTEQIIFRLKLHNGRLKPGIGIACELLRQADFKDLAHLKDVIQEMYNDYKASLIPQGHHYAMVRAGSKLSPVVAVQERWDGLEQFLFLHELCIDLDGKLEETARCLDKIREFLLSAFRLKINITAQENNVQEIITCLDKELAAVPEIELEFEQKSEVVRSGEPSLFETFVFSASINFVAHALPGAVFGTREYAAESVMGHILKTSYLWERVRMRGGAYGVFSLPLGFEKLFCFSSYRDPNVSTTLNAFKDVLQDLARAKIERSDLEKAIIGTVSGYEIPHRPHERGFIAFKRKLLKMSDEIRQKNREYILKVHKKEITARAERLLAQFTYGSTVILTNAEKMKQERKDNLINFQNITQLPV
ncbi:MAG: insulinase family protein [Spirochaetales bacterium]|nr:insulinase family protein [Spirochaetales bacterium]